MGDGGGDEGGGGEKQKDEDMQRATTGHMLQAYTC